MSVFSWIEHLMDQACRQGSLLRIAWNKVRVRDSDPDNRQQRLDNLESAIRADAQRDLNGAITSARLVFMEEEAGEDCNIWNMGLRVWGDLIDEMAGNNLKDATLYAMLPLQELLPDDPRAQTVFNKFESLALRLADDDLALAVEYGRQMAMRLISGTAVGQASFKLWTRLIDDIAAMDVVDALASARVARDDDSPEMTPDFRNFAALKAAALDVVWNRSLVLEAQAVKPLEYTH